MIQLTFLWFGRMWVNSSCIVFVSDRRSNSEEQTKSLIWTVGVDYPHECTETVDEVLEKIRSVR